MEPATIITLDVGGTIFKSTVDTLIKSGYFSALLNSDHWNFDTSKPYFIDRSAMLFEHVLSYLRNPNYPYPAEHIGELDFYGIHYDESQFITRLRHIYSR